MTQQWHTDQATDQDSATILPLLSGEGDQRLLHEWVESHEQYTLTDPSATVETAEFDLCVLDGESLEQHAEALRERKQRADPVLLPCLLLLPEADISVLEADRSEIADNVVFETVDEIVSMPIRKVELEWRTEALLRLRSQSMTLDRKRRELRLFKRATEAAGHAVYITDTEGVIQYVNPAFERMTGYSAEETVGETPAMFDSGEMSEAYFDRLWRTVEDGNRWEEDLINRRKDGELYHAHQTIAPVVGPDGEPTHFVAVQADITDRVELNQELTTFREIVERIEDPIMLQDMDGQFRIVNQAVAKYADMSPEELRGTDEYAFMDEASATRIEEYKQRVLEEERVARYSISPTFPEESDVTFSTVRYPHYTEDGELNGTVAICRNVTELEMRDEQLRIIDRVLRHNLRNNMTTVGMFAEKLESVVPVEEEESARRIRRTSEQVMKLVEKQREITKFLTDPPDDRTINLVTLVETVAGEATDQHPAADIRCEMPETCPIEATTAVGDAIVELVENAVVHNESDEPVVDIVITDEGDGATLSVGDRGPPIPEMEREVLTGERAIDPLYHGSGLGLWFVNLIVTHSGGKVVFTENNPQGNVVSLAFGE